VAEARPYSYTRIFDVARCPWAYEQRYLLKNKGAQKSDEEGPAAFGLAFHDLASELIRDLAKRREPQNPELAQKKLNSYIENAKTSMEYLEPLQQIFVESFAHKFVVNLDTYYGSETPIALDEHGDQVAWNHEKAFVRGKLDYLEYDAVKKLLTIIDFKTNLGVPNWTEFATSHFIIQLEFYSWLTYKWLKKLVPDIMEINVGDIFVRWGGWRGFKILTNEMGKIEDKILRRIDRLERLKSFRPIPCGHCQYCPFLTTDCPVKSKIVGAVKTAQAASSVLKEIIYLEARLTERKRQLKTYVDGTEKTPAAGEYSMGYTPTSNTKYHSDISLEILNGQKIDITPFVKLNKTAVDKLDPDTRALLNEKARYVDNGTQFKLKKS
jgi:RecB family exonuclease